MLIENPIIEKINIEGIKKKEIKEIFLMILYLFKRSNVI